MHRVSLFTVRLLLLLQALTWWIPIAAGASPTDPHGEDVGQILVEARRLRDSGAFQESAAAFRRLLDSQPSAWEIRFELSQILLTLRDLDGAETELQRAILTAPGEAALWARLGQVYLLKKDPGHAERSLVRARDLAPMQPDVRYNLALLYETLGDIEKAFREYRVVLDTGGPEEIVRQAAKKTAQYYLIVDRPEEALGSYRRAAEIFPSRAWPHEQLAELLYRMSRHEEALAEYDIVLGISPENSAAHFNVGFMSKMRGDLERAEREFSSALALAPGSPKTLYELGAVLFEKGDYDAAAKKLGEAVAADPNHLQAHYYYARALSKLGRREEALREMEIHKELKKKDDMENPNTTMGAKEEDPG